jgi:hypothetical protein
MATYYTVVQYLPNPLSGERMNVGLIAWSAGRIAARFIDDWRRVQSFGGEDIEFIRDFVRRVSEAAEEHQPMLTGFGDSRRLDEDRLKQIVGSWTHSVQFTEPRTSLKSPEEVLNELGPIFLRPTHRRVNKGRDRRTAAALVAHSVWTSVMQVVEKPAHELLKRSYPIKGKLDEHPFDVVIANGKPFFAAQGLSFEIADTRTLDKELQATAWAITDVRRGHRDFPLAVLTLPPIGKLGSILFDRAQKVFHGLGATVADSPDDIERWARRLAKKSLVHAGQ